MWPLLPPVAPRRSPPSPSQVCERACVCLHGCVAVYSLRAAPPLAVPSPTLRGMILRPSGRLLDPDCSLLTSSASPRPRQLALCFLPSCAAPEAPARTSSGPVATPNYSFPSTTTPFDDFKFAPIREAQVR